MAPILSSIVSLNKRSEKIILKKKHLLIVLISIGIIGTVIFFPVNINDHYTCLFHRLQDNSITLSEISLHDGGNNMHHSILEIYLQGYAFLWWTSIALFTISIIFLKKIVVREFKGKQ